MNWYFVLRRHSLTARALIALTRALPFVRSTLWVEHCRVGRNTTHWVRVGVGHRMYTPAH